MTPLSIRREPDSAPPSVRRYASGSSRPVVPLDAPRDCPTHGPMTLDQQWFGGYYGYARICLPCRRAAFDGPGAAA